MRGSRKRDRHRWRISITRADAAPFAGVFRVTYTGVTPAAVRSRHVEGPRRLSVGVGRTESSSFDVNCE
jgi:hypothetical protein